MNKPPLWIIENIAREFSYEELIAAVKAQNYNLIEIRGDFEYKIFDDIIKNGDRPTIFNGSINMAKLVYNYLKQNNNLIHPITYSDFDKYLCSNYYGYFGDYLFNDKYIIVPFNDLYRQRFDIYGYLGKNTNLFIRPDSGEKTFQAQLVDLLDLEKFIKTNQYQNELIVISSPKNIKGEWRFVVSGEDKKIITYSTYQYQGKVTKSPGAPREAIDLCQELLNNINYYPDKVFCYDICQGMDDKYYLLELTSFSSAGLYACNKKLIVEEVTKIAIKDYEDNSVPF